MAVILVGDDPASQIYVSVKEKACEKVQKMLAAMRVIERKIREIQTDQRNQCERKSLQISHKELSHALYARRLDAHPSVGLDSGCSFGWRNDELLSESGERGE